MHPSQGNTGNPFRLLLSPEQQVTLDQLRAGAISRFGFDAFRMEDTGDSGSSGDTGGDSSAGQSGDANDNAAGQSGSGGDTGGGNSGGQQTAEKVEDLPEWAQKIIKDSRGQAAESRTKATTAEKKQAETLDAIAKALGLKGEEKADPAKLQAQLDATQRQAREAAIELAVYRKAGTHKADPDALLDSRSFLAKVNELDPSAKDFADKVEAAIKDAVKENPKLKTGQAPGSSSADHGTGGTGENGKREPKPLDQAVAGHYAT